MPEGDQGSVIREQVEGDLNCRADPTSRAATSELHNVGALSRSPLDVFEDDLRNLAPQVGRRDMGTN